MGMLEQARGQLSQAMTADASEVVMFESKQMKAKYVPERVVSMFNAFLLVEPHVSAVEKQIVRMNNLHSASKAQ